MDTAVRDAFCEAARRWRDPDHDPRRKAVAATLEMENYFTEEAIAFAVNQQMHLIEEEPLEEWLGGRAAGDSLTVGVIHPGNVPLAGLQDLLAVLGTGHRYLGRPSRRSAALLPAWGEELQAIEPDLPIGFADSVDALLERAEAVIATGRDETVGELEERCEVRGIGAEQRLLRGHSYGVALIDGEETEEEREGLAEDVFLHEGRGCRNVALVFAPAGLDPDPYFETFGHFRHVFPPHPETDGALEMARAFLEATDAPRAWGPGILISRGDPEVQGPGHLRWVEYEDEAAPQRYVRSRTEEIQLVVARPDLAERLDLPVPICAPGEAQRPRLGWCPDGVDTAGWLAGLA